MLWQWHGSLQLDFILTFQTMLPSYVLVTRNQPRG